MSFFVEGTWKGLILLAALVCLDKAVELKRLSSLTFDDLYCLLLLAVLPTCLLLVVGYLPELMVC